MPGGIPAFPADSVMGSITDSLMSPDKGKGQSFAVPITCFSCFLAVFLYGRAARYTTGKGDDSFFANNESENVDGSVMEKSSTKKSRKRKRKRVLPDQDIPSTKSSKDDDDDDDVSDNKGSNNVDGGADNVGVCRNDAHCADMGSSKGNKEGGRGHSGANGYQSEQRSNNNKGGKGVDGAGAAAEEEGKAEKSTDNGDGDNSNDNNSNDDVHKVLDILVLPSCPSDSHDRSHAPGLVALHGPQATTG
ncbi:hypothetical protein THAOC_12182 [Thalassiosira oceanica]|uniref:Uncharacterized protein n=1 Tax=Thalassiosira oceanica TaxID=159749 RepID=K0T8M3_THAOC|nr:hypothetical protein THAOC_12182 [Thalassiosira oceanica]|eukprot:EJK66852.1 hypothetical protein THAOC_12182 [Thalassiosira oceanica]